MDTDGSSPGLRIGGTFVVFGQSEFMAEKVGYACRSYKT